jgi:hypothetical protein
LSHTLASVSNGIVSMCVVMLALTLFAAMAMESFAVAPAGMVAVYFYNRWGWGCCPC